MRDFSRCKETKPEMSLLELSFPKILSPRIMTSSSSLSLQPEDAQSQIIIESSTLTLSLNKDLFNNLFIVNVSIMSTGPDPLRFLESCSTQRSVSDSVLRCSRQGRSVNSLKASYISSEFRNDRNNL